MVPLDFGGVLHIAHFVTSSYLSSIQKGIGSQSPQLDTGYRGTGVQSRTGSLGPVTEQHLGGLHNS